MGYSTKAILIASCAVFLTSALYLLASRDFTDVARFRFDMVTYQFLGVNLALGHGFQIGAIEEPSVYRFDAHDFNHRFYRYIAPRRHAYSFGRAPGYPLFIAAIYRLFGVHPRAVKIAQVLLLSLCAALLPVVGRLYWGVFGLWCGVAAAALFVLFFCPDPSVLMSEPLALAGLVLWVLAFVHWERRPSILRAALAGGAGATALLIKPAGIFLPLLFVVWAFVRVKSPKPALAMGSAHIAAVLLFIAPWSAYATARNELPGTTREGARLIALSTQGRFVLLDGNNEDSLADGRWHPQWRTSRKNHERYLYHRLDYSKRSSASLVIRFWRGNADQLADLFTKKLKSAFYMAGDIAVTLSALACYGAFFLSWLWQRRNRAANERTGALARIPVFPALLFLNIIGVTLVLFGDRRFVLPFFYFWLLPAVFLPLWGIRAAVLRVFAKSRRTSRRGIALRSG